MRDGTECLEGLHYKLAKRGQLNESSIVLQNHTTEHLGGYKESSERLPLRHFVYVDRL